MWIIIKYKVKEINLVLNNLKKEPILDLKLRLGEGSGAAIASLILKAALATHNGMSTFDNAKVSKKITS